MQRIISVGAVVIVALILSVGTVFAEQITVVGWNVESGGANMGVLAKQMQSLKGVDLWGFSEVLDESWVKTFRASAKKATGSNFRDIISNSGGRDRLLVLFNLDKFDLLEHSELHYMNPGYRVRSPLVVLLRSTQGGQEFLFIVNHLYRGNAEARLEQAEALAQWSKEQTLPIIAVGDYNFDYDIATEKHNPGFDAMVTNGPFMWIRPAKLVRTNCDMRFPAAILDFIFLAGPAKDWKASSKILFPEDNYCPDGETKSDHRPVEATIDLP